MKLKLFVFILLLIESTFALAQQFDVSADLRERYEFRNGYSTLMGANQAPASFVLQRARLIFEYSDDKIKLKFSPQNVSTWGEVTTTEKAGLSNSFHEAYGEFKLTEMLIAKIGRQEIVYDDQRIFGSLDWLMQARSHDALLFKFKPNDKHRLDVGFALNATKESNTKVNYILKQYKNFQYAWYHGDFKNLGLSFLAMNNGIAYLQNGNEKISYSQTIGPRLTFNKGKFKSDASVYVQTGKIDSTNMFAHYIGLNASYQVLTTFNVALGLEVISGRASNDITSDYKSFSLLYGMNHKFNGYMDYFYVNNHINSVGLKDVYGIFTFTKDKFNAKFIPHYFLTGADLYNTFGEKQDSYLGTELDFTIGYKLYENVTLDAGYSQMFATNSMQVLKGGDKSKDNNWVFAMVKINPKLFSHKIVKVDPNIITQ